MFGLRDLAAERGRDLGPAGALARRPGAERRRGYPHTLSGGEQQRVALARSIAPRPGVLLMDEPFSNLDRRMRDLIRDETVAILRETGATTIVVTHDPEEAMMIADRIVLMRSGQIVQQGSAEEIYTRPVDLFAARFFCDFNEVEGVIEGGQVSTPVGVFAGPASCRGRERDRVHPAAGCPPAPARRSACRAGSSRGASSARWISSTSPCRGSTGRCRPASRGPAGLQAGQDVGRRYRPARSPCFRRVSSLGWPRVDETSRARKHGAGGTPWVALAFGTGSSSG